MSISLFVYSLIIAYSFFCLLIRLKPGNLKFSLKTQKMSIFENFKTQTMNLTEQYSKSDVKGTVSVI